MEHYQGVPADNYYFAFVDIMGFREQVKQAATSDTVRETAERISATMRRAKDEYGEMMRMLEEKWEEYEERPLQVFSDLAWYAERVHDGKSNVFSFVNRLLILNAGLASDAVHPRIIVAENVGEAYLGAVQRHPRIEHDARKALWRNGDGGLFVNYLVVLSINRGWDEEQCGDFLRKHKRNIQYQLVAYSSNPYIRAKYLWLARYHNRYCRRRYKGRCLASLIVPNAPNMGPSTK